MDDVYISDPRQASAQVIAQKKKDKQNSLKRRNFRQFLFDLIVNYIFKNFSKNTQSQHSVNDRCWFSC